MYIGYTNNELYDLFMYELVENEDRRLEKLHKATLQLIIHGNVNYMGVTCCPSVTQNNLDGELSSLPSGVRKAIRPAEHR